VRPPLLAACLMAVLLAVAPPSTSASAEGGRSADQSCGTADVSVTTHQGLMGMGHFSLVISVKNESAERCSFTGYPFIGLLGPGGAPSGWAVDSLSESLGTASASSRGPVRITLRPGQFASALLGGTDVPVGGATTCPTAAYTVRLPGSHSTRRLTGTVDRCSGVFVGPFVPGFNGIFPSGEMVGAAPACRPTTPSPSAPGPAVQVDAWSGTTLAGSVGVLTSGRSTRRYELILEPGHYRLTTAGQRTRRIVIRSGVLDDIGLYGGCSLLSATAPSTVPARNGVVATTSTTTSMG
jgi:hypothetical protein